MIIRTFPAHFDPKPLKISFTKNHLSLNVSPRKIFERCKIICMWFLSETWSSTGQEHACVNMFQHLSLISESRDPGYTFTGEPQRSANYHPQLAFLMFPCDLLWRKNNFVFVQCTEDKGWKACFFNL